MVADGVKVRRMHLTSAVVDNVARVVNYSSARSAPTGGDVVSDHLRDSVLKTMGGTLGRPYDVFTWDDTGPDGRRCRFDMVVHRALGEVAFLFHTEFFTRVACATHEERYAEWYVSVTDPESGVTTVVQPCCDECVGHLRESAVMAGMVLNLSGRLHTGQHD